MQTLQLASTGNTHTMAMALGLLNYSSRRANWHFRLTFVVHLFAHWRSSKIMASFGLNGLLLPSFGWSQEDNAVRAVIHSNRVNVIEHTDVGARAVLNNNLLAFHTPRLPHHRATCFVFNRKVL